MFRNKIFTIILLFSLTQGQEADLSKDPFELLKLGIREFVSTGIKPQYLEASAKHYQLPNFFRHGLPQQTYSMSDDQMCGLCEVFVSVTLEAVRKGLGLSEITQIVSELCVILGIEDERVCDYTIGPNAELLLQIVNLSPSLTSDKVCSLLLNGCTVKNESNWTIDIPEGNSIERPLVRSGEPFQFLHISDFHYDPLYNPKGNSKCGEPLCCQIDQPEPENEEDICGYWLNYNNADTPIHTVREVLDETKKHDFDFIYYTGDIISHRVWSTSVENNTNTIKTIFNEFKKNFDVPVYAALGNHEPHPLNIWTPTEITNTSYPTQWLLNLWSEELKEWVSENALETIKKGGYYTHSPRDGFRIIVLNTNLCYLENWWLLYNDNDPFGQLAWLVEVLSEAEKKDESVHLVYHVPTGGDNCFVVYSRNFRNIIERYANTITGQFNGHTHKDQFSIYYNRSDPNQALGVAFNGASVTTYTDSNPSFKVYQADLGTNELLDYEEWTFNLTEANLDPTKSPNWYKLYSFKEAYGVEDLTPTEIGKLLIRMAGDTTLLDKYQRYYYRDGDSGLSYACGEDCYKDILCSIAMSENNDFTSCDIILKIYEDNQHWN